MFVVLFSLTLTVLQPPKTEATKPVPKIETAKVDIASIKAAIAKASAEYITQAHKLSGTITVQEIDGDKKTVTQKTTIKGDPRQFIVYSVNGEQRLTSGQAFRTFGDVKQLLALGYDNRQQAPVIRTERYRRESEVNQRFPVEYDRIYAGESATTIAMRPAVQWGWTLQDLIENDAVKVTQVEELKEGNSKLVKITFVVDKEIDKNQSDNSQLVGINNGVIVARPDHAWTIQRSEMELQPDSRKPPRIWKAEFVYVEPAAPIPLVKEIRVTSEPGPAPDQKKVNRLFNIEMKMADKPLPDAEFSLAPLKIQDRNADAWLKQDEARIKAEAEEKEKVAKLSPDQLKLASQGLQVSPWVLLVGGTGAFVLLVIAVIWMTRKSRSATPTE